jgi:hypothetical protein
VRGVADRFLLTSARHAPTLAAYPRLRG